MTVRGALAEARAWQPSAGVQQAEFFTAASLAGVPIPPRLWHVSDLVPAGTVTMLGGDGGVGKSILALQLAVATSARRRWLGIDTAAGGAMYVSAEDGRDELHRRLASIVEGESIAWDDLDRLSVCSLAGQDALLAVQDPRTGALSPTALFDELDQRLATEQPALVVLDTLADLHSGQENDRTVARQFIGLLRGLAIRHETTVVLLAHPSLTGMSSGSGLSGSTAWNASVRSRLFLERVEEDGYEADPNRRRLVVKKANYAAKGQELGLTWRDGVFVPDAVETEFDRVAGNLKAERVFLSLLREFTANGRHVSAQPSATFAPSVFSASPNAEGITKRAFRSAMEALFASKRIAMAQHGNGQKARSHIVEVPNG